MTGVPRVREPDRATTEALAREVGLDLETFIDTFGGPWAWLDQEPDHDDDPSALGDLLGPWFISGEPYQLMLRRRPDAVELASPPSG